MKSSSDRRLRNMSLTLLAIFVVAFVIQFASGMSRDVQSELVAAKDRFALDAELKNKHGTLQVSKAEVDLHFQQAVMMLHAKKYDYAVTSLKKTIELSPQMPEAYVNMGFALLGLEDPQSAREYFMTAIDLRPQQANAYWGLAVSLEQSCDYDGAIGAMRTYIHLSEASAENSFLKKAQAAVWEWDEIRKKSTTDNADPLHACDGKAITSG